MKKKLKTSYVGMSILSGLIPLFMGIAGCFDVFSLVFGLLGSEVILLIFLWAIYLNGSHVENVEQ